jgi:hypothetical protein
VIRLPGDIGEIHEHVDFDRFGTVIVKSRSAKVEAEEFPVPMGMEGLGKLNRCDKVRRILLMHGLDPRLCFQESPE